MSKPVKPEAGRSKHLFGIVASDAPGYEVRGRPQSCDSAIALVFPRSFGAALARAENATRPLLDASDKPQKVCWRRLPRWVMWWGIPGTTTRASLGMAPLLPPAAAHVNQYLSSISPDHLRLLPG